MKISIFNLYLYKIFSFLKREDIHKGIEEKIFHFDAIEYYFRNKKDLSSHCSINDKTINDIDFYEVFKYLDKTKSKIGQQYFFNQLLTLNTNNDFKEQEIWIEYLHHNPENRIKIEKVLSKLDKRESYYLSNLFLDEYIKKPKWFWITRIFMFLPIITFLLSFVLSFFLYLFTLSIVINLAFHYHNKRNIFLYKDSIPQLLILHRCAKSILSMNLPTKADESLTSSMKSIDRLRSKISMFEMESRTDSDIYALLFLVIEYIKIIFLLEPLVVFNVLNQLDKKREDIQRLFEYIGKIDSYVSITSLRNDIPYYCIPAIPNTPTKLKFKDLYHPLIINCVTNTLDTDNKSVLLTGSNMAGKTTFIRTIAINVLLAQTINTCFAKEFKLYPMRIFSAIRVSDDLLNDRSYYFEEVLSIKDMIEKSSDIINNLFLLDEIFKGTNTIERIAAGKAVLSYLATFENNIVFVSTHDVELTELLNDRYNLYHFSEVIQEGQIHFDYKLKKGQLSTRNAIRILEINGYPQEIIHDAKRISDTLQQKKNNH